MIYYQTRFYDITIHIFKQGLCNPTGYCGKLDIKNLEALQAFHAYSDPTHHSFRRKIKSQVSFSQGCFSELSFSDRKNVSYYSSLLVGAMKQFN